MQVFEAGEWFCGAGRVWKRFVECEDAAFGFDWELNSLQDFTSPEGFIAATELERQSKVYSLGHWDTVCASWVWMSRKHCRRSFIDVRGNRRCKSVLAGNVMVVRMLIISLYHLAKLGVYLLEQPVSFGTLG